MTTYEDRCEKLAGEVSTYLDKFPVSASDDLSGLSARVQADLILADYKFKFRQADHVKQLSYVPLAISVATFALALILAGISIFQLHQKEHDTQASLILKVLAAPPGQGQHLLSFFTDAGLLKLEGTQQKQLEALLPK